MTLLARAVLSPPLPVILSPSTPLRTGSAKNLGTASPGFASLAVCSAFREERSGGTPPLPPVRGSFGAAQDRAAPPVPALLPVCPFGRLPAGWGGGAGR